MGYFPTAVARFRGGIQISEGGFEQEATEVTEEAEKLCPTIYSVRSFSVRVSEFCPGGIFFLFFGATLFGSVRLT
jgi:hypothetical protein